MTASWRVSESGGQHWPGFAYLPAFIGSAQADRVLDRLWRELAWSQPAIRLYGRLMQQPRLVAWYGDPDAVYSYSGLRLEPLPWHPVLRSLRRRLEQHCNQQFNSVLANAYRDGNDSMGWHSDDEPELGPCPVIASLSLGAPRRFLLRRRERERGERSRSMLLEHGSLLLMTGDSQRLYQHALPRSRQAVGLRINLTFRQILERESRRSTGAVHRP
jgi:alkylated DNA repair dioxygenase AlkB